MNSATFLVRILLIFLHALEEREQIQYCSILWVPLYFMLKKCLTNTYFLFFAGEITNFSRLIEMCMEGFPQAVILISLLIVSIEHKNIRGWIVNTLDTQLLPYTVIFAIFAIKTIFGYVMTVSNIRYDFVCKFYDLSCKCSLYIINRHYIFLWN